ncbi:leukocyte elastase inhibitor-like isoform X2 [Ornithodoros turicata]|uniref:leukocyte elastase inhibitor-like isoform X2 n=1 Tax=Ornithodoros turicata TaxID=34597 RepID=UPI0031392AD6
MRTANNNVHIWTSWTPGLHSMEMKGDLTQPMLNVAVEIYKRQPSRNVFFSPFSIVAALSMILPGTRGDTAKQIAATLHIQEDTHKAFSQLLKSLQRYARDITLKIATRIYALESLKPLDDFCAFLKDCYSTSIESVDFGDDAVRREINAWVEQVTNGKIKDLLLPGAVSCSTVLILVNAVYFKGAWRKSFEECDTTSMDFHTTSSTTKVVKMMFRNGCFKMAYNKELKANALQLPYSGNAAFMIVLLPDNIDGLKFLQERVTPQNLSFTLRVMKMKEDVDLYLPKFKVEQTMELKKVLMDLGVKDLFECSADLTGITERSGVRFSDVVHKAFVDVNEEGTEAAAATSMVMTDSLPIAGDEPKVFKVDHPFMFLIMAGDVVLFVGSLSDPE